MFAPFFSLAILRVFCEPIKMSNILSFLKNLISKEKKLTKLQQEKIKKLHDTIAEGVTSVMYKCKSWNNSDFLNYFELVQNNEKKKMDEILNK